jgi:acyl carrier protein
MFTRLTMTSSAPRSFQWAKRQSMIESNIFHIFTRIVQNALRDDSIVLTCQTTAREVKGWDSLKQVLLEVEDKFGITLHSWEIDSIKCVGDFIAVIGHRTRGKIDGMPANNTTSVRSSCG